MKSFGIFLISVALVAYGESRSAGEALVNRVASLSELMTKAQTDLAKLGKELHSNLNIPNRDAFIATLQSQSASLVDNLKTYISQMSDAIKAKNPEFGKAWTGMKESLNKVVDDISAQIPLAKEQAVQLEAKLMHGINTMAKQSELVTQTISKNSAVLQDDVTNIVKKAIETAIDTTAQLSGHIQQQAVGTMPKA